MRIFAGIMLCVAFVSADPFQGGADFPAMLFPGREVSARVEPQPGVRVFTFSVPPSTVAARLRVRAGGSVEVAVRREGRVVARSVGEGWEVWLTRWERTLRPGTYVVEVGYEGDVGDGVDVSLLFSLVSGEASFDIETGRPVRLVLSPEQAMCTVGRLKVPQGVPALRVDVLDAEGDVDLFLAPGTAVPDPRAASHRATTPLGRESLVVGEGLAPGDYALMVADLRVLEAPEEVVLLVRFEESPPPLEARGPVLSPVVQVVAGRSMGSGVLVSEDGKILTALHVVEGGEEVVVAVTREEGMPPDELFRAEVILEDEVRDLALLRLTADLYGRPLPEGIDFPVVTPAFSEMRVGSRITLVGYPPGVGLRSRPVELRLPSLVAGRERVWTEGGRRDLLKVSGWIGEGMSGGAVFDEQGRLVGILTGRISDGWGGLGVVVAAHEVPSDWWHR